MAIYALLKNFAFGPDEIKVMTTVYDAALKTLGITDRADPMAEMLARNIIELAKRGERNPERVCERVLGGGNIRSITFDRIAFASIASRGLPHR